MHSLALHFGVYTDAGNFTCGGRIGSGGHEDIDAHTYAAWMVDAVKVDNCFGGGVAPEIRFATMSAALNATGRPMLLAMCEWGVDSPFRWGASVANAWRTGGDMAGHSNEHAYITCS